MKSISHSFLINLIGFQLLWPAAVLGAARGSPQLAWWVLGIMVVLMVVAGAAWKRDLKMVVVGFVACALLEPVWLGSGLIKYTGTSSTWLAPGWIWALWGGFALSFFYCLAWLQRRPLLAALFGGFGGGFSVMMGVHLGAAEAPLGEWRLMLVYGAVWAGIVPLFAALATLLDKSCGPLKREVGNNG